MKVVVESTALSAILEETNKYPKHETGGILIGLLEEDGQLRVTLVSGPGPKAIHKTASFVRDGEYAQQFLDEARATNQRLQYLGEWHSHAGNPSPSGQDIQSLAKITTDAKYNAPDAIIAIINSRDSSLKAYGIKPLGEGFFASYVRELEIPADEASDGTKVRSGKYSS